MLDLLHLPNNTGNADTQVFPGTSTASGTGWVTWQKPRGKSMFSLFLVSKGGQGGAGAIGANSTAAGGGGGGSSAQTIISAMPLYLIPDVLFLSIAGRSATTTLVSYVSVAPNTTAANILAIANGGGNGGAAAGATAGTAGTAGTVATGATMPLGFNFSLVQAGQAGTAGTGASVAAGSTGLLVCGGAGGAALGASGGLGVTGGGMVWSGLSGFSFLGGTGAASATTPPGNGQDGIQPIPGLGLYFGGTGGGSSHGSATGTGLIQASGGNGHFGSGGGGSGGALTGSTTGVAGQGGPGLCIITCW